MNQEVAVFDTLKQKNNILVQNMNWAKTRGINLILRKWQKTQEVRNWKTGKDGFQDKSG